MKTDITIAIVTKNRTNELKRCLSSIRSQIVKPESVIIIDNDENRTAKQLLTQKSYQKLNISYHHSLGSVPKCRNLALKICQTTYLAFTDDDCIFEQKWLEKASSLLKKNNYDFIVGQTKLFNPNNIFALAQHARDEYWKGENTPMFDTKNVILNVRRIRKYNLQFDVNCQKELYDSADFDFDFQIKKHKLKGHFSQKMTISHQETSQLKRFCKRAYYRGFLGKYLNKKWHLDHRLVDLSTSNFIIWLLKFIKNYNLDYARYTKRMQSENKCKKILAICIIKIFEYCYVLGYVENREDN